LRQHRMLRGPELASRIFGQLQSRDR
jgi:hypothetical protein